VSEMRYHRDFFDLGYPLFGKFFTAFFRCGWLSSVTRHDETLRSNTRRVQISCTPMLMYAWVYISLFHTNIMFHILSSFQFYRYTWSHIKLYLLQKWKCECVI